MVVPLDDGGTSDSGGLGPPLPMDAGALPDAGTEPLPSGPVLWEQWFAFTATQDGNLPGNCQPTLTWVKGTQVSVGNGASCPASGLEFRWDIAPSNVYSFSSQVTAYAFGFNAGEALSLEARFNASSSSAPWTPLFHVWFKAWAPGTSTPRGPGTLLFETKASVRVETIASLPGTCQLTAKSMQGNEYQIAGTTDCDAAYLEHRHGTTGPGIYTTPVQPSNYSISKGTQLPIQARLGAGAPWTTVFVISFLDR